MNSTSFEIAYPDTAIQFGFACCIFLVIFGCLGNAITIFALLKSATLRVAATSIFVISLCTTDFIFCAFNLPLTAARYYHKAWVMGDTLCKLFPFFFYMNVAASLYHIMMISVNRFVLITRYSSYPKVYRPGIVGAMILFCWAFPFCLLLPTLLEKWGTFGYNPETFSCTILKVDGKSPKKLLLFVGVVPPCLVTAICYALIFAKFRQSRKSLQQSTQKVDNALTKVVLVIFCTFLACYGPLILVNTLDHDEETVPWLHVVASVLAWCSAVTNPVIYAAMNPRYRKAYVALFPRRFRGMLQLDLSRTRTSDLSRSSGSARSVCRPPAVVYQQRDDQVVIRN